MRDGKCAPVTRRLRATVAVITLWCVVAASIIVGIAHADQTTGISTNITGSSSSISSRSVEDPSANAEYVLGVVNRTYFYGVTRPMVDRLLNRSSIPHLIDILGMGDTFEFQDNTVVFLGYLSNDTDDAVAALRSYWSAFTTATTAAARRSVLLIPHALSLMIQLRQSSKARDFALELMAHLEAPEHSAIHAILPRISARRREQAEAAASIVKQLVRGLALDNESAAMVGFEQVVTAADALPPNDDLTAALGLLTVSLQRELDQGVQRDLTRQQDHGDGFFSFFPRKTNNDNASSGSNNDDDDDSVYSAAQGDEAILMSWCQHTAITDPFTEEVVTAVTHDMSVVTAQAQSDFDVPCCIGFANAGQGVAFAYRLLLHLYPHRILYTEIFYEDLTGPHGNHYFRALQHLLGMKPTALNTAGLVRVHPGHCSAKITNWPALRRYFLKHGLHQAVRACELPAGKI
ncbi:hypothetical protein PTSG_06110 [Salpingoeca rosetta]|uniref:Uncharacterized protein n=1 Tax=Salpingoeca rosetta (strain ATCC 50818 / BSB-021) TaxID=946362 RepID=F2UDQ2_SALR5|nr:uncharacterized protein PTSG_06110 [Salpingoeca rosetta]EGD74747.1 hypothetical protein PTSG_06110 [Salpingoeca rosetta]|eukprot:XP_004993004.1 hypothetical protein PTSG_06110 [Salpingoeca rosetta]